MKLSRVSISFLVIFFVTTGLLLFACTSDDDDVNAVADDDGADNDILPSGVDYNGWLISDSSADVVYRIDDGEWTEVSIPDGITYPLDAVARFGRSNDSWMNGYSKEFAREMSALGWIGMTWPVAALTEDSVNSSLPR